MMAYIEIKCEDLWKPEKKGDMVEGILINKTEGKFGDNYDLEHKSEIISLPALTVLNKKIKKASFGDQIRVQYNGLIKSKLGREYKDFTVWVKKNE